LLAGWYEPEASGRWTADDAWFRIPGRGVETIVVKLHVEPGRSVRVLEGERLVAEPSTGDLVFRPAAPDRPLLRIETLGIRVTREQRRNGDARRIGTFVSGISWKDETGVHRLDLQAPSVLPTIPVTLNRDRFRLALNRSVVRFADAFIVHSRYVRDLVLEERNSPTPIGILSHGAEIRWRDSDRREIRAALRLSAEWIRSFLIVSFGGVQPHKRIDQALRALALARRERPDVRLVLAGSLQSNEFDPQSLARSLGLEDAVHFTGFLTEDKAWEWLHAGDIALNLRGPTTGGTSGGIFQAFSLGRPVIASDAAEQRELPDTCVVKVPLGNDEVEILARELVRLRDTPERRAQLEAGVRRFVQEECHWGIVARRYAEYMSSFPGPRVSRKKLVALKLAQK
jgi:glycosyltransferase involved in cell wall biosynthesis